MKAQANRTVVLVNGRYLFNGSMPAHRALIPPERASGPDSSLTRGERRQLNMLHCTNPFVIVHRIRG